MGGVENDVAERVVADPEVATMAARERVVSLHVAGRPAAGAGVGHGIQVHAQPPLRDDTEVGGGKREVHGGAGQRVERGPRVLAGHSSESGPLGLVGGGREELIKSPPVDEAGKVLLPKGEGSPVGGVDRGKIGEGARDVCIAGGVPRIEEGA